MINKCIKVRLYPTVKQKQMLDAHFDAYRYCYNLCLDYKKVLWDNYKIEISGYEMQKELFEIRKSTPWLKKCKAECLRDAALNVEKSYKKFFNGNGFPKFKSKKGEQSFAAYQNIAINSSKVKFFKTIFTFKTSKKYINILNEKSIKRLTFKKDNIGDYFATFLIESDGYVKMPYIDKSVGIDLGVSDLAITSDGVKYPNNRYLKNSHFKIKKLQRRFEKSKKGGKNRNKLRIKIAKLHRRVFRQREHYYHQITNELIRDNQTIVLESLGIKNMIKNHSLARSISDVSWGLFTETLKYKANWHGREIVKLDRFYPSTKTCSSCGAVKDVLLKERVYNCECGLSLDRDINAAINIRNSGLKIPGVLMEGVGYEPDEVRSKQLIINN